MPASKGKRQKSTASQTEAPTMEAVARIAGVSTMTVSRVLSGKGYVGQETRRKVEETVRKTGYIPNFSARSLASAEAPFIGLAYLNPSGGYLGEFLIGALSAARGAGLHVILEACSFEPRDWADELSSFAKQSQLRGLILPPPLCDDESVLEAASMLDIPTVRVSPSRHEPGFASIRIDEYRAAFEMTTKLIKMGHRDIGFVKGPDNQEAAKQRHAGFVDAMQQAGVAIVRRWVGNGDFSPGPASDFGRRILSRKERPSAIFASNDDMAAGIYTAAHQAGLRIPDDISIVGFDDQPIAKSLWPGLTTVHQPIAAMAGRAVELIAASSKNDPASTEAARDIIFPYEIMSRGSLAKPAKS